MQAAAHKRFGRLLAAGFASLAIAFGSAATTRADIVSTFTSTQTGDYSYTSGGGTATLSSVNPLNGFVTFGSTFFTPQGPYAGIINLLATSTSTVSGGQEDGFSGSYTIYNNSGGTVGGVAQGGAMLTVNFTNASLTVGNGSATLQNLLPTSTVTITSFLAGSAPLSQPESFSLSLSGLNPTNPGVNGSGFFNNFLGNDTNTASATIGAVPEPSTMAIAAISALGMIGYGLRRRKAMGA